MNKQLDEVAAEILRDELVDRGIHIHFLDQVVMWKGEAWIDEVFLASGKTLRDVTLIHAMGTVPNVELAGACGLMVNRGVVVDEAMRTSDPDILALGEIAEYDGQFHGIGAAAEEQARVAAAALAGDAQAVYQGSMAQNLVKVDGLTVVSLGIARPPADDLSYEEIVYLDRASRVYRKCVIRNDRLVGALLVGDNSDFVQLRDLVRSGEELGARRAACCAGIREPRRVVEARSCAAVPPSTRAPLARPASAAPRPCEPSWTPRGQGLAVAVVVPRSPPFSKRARRLPSS